MGLVVNVPIFLYYDSGPCIANDEGRSVNPVGFAVAGPSFTDDDPAPGVPDNLYRVDFSLLRLLVHVDLP